MKYQGELALLVVLVLALLMRPMFLKRMLNTFVGRVFMLVAVLALASKNKNYGFLGALIMISLLQSFQEGFEGKDEESHKEGEDKDGEHKDGEDKDGDKEGEHKKEDKDGDKDGEHKDGDKEGEDKKEGFSLLPRMDMRFSEMDPLEAENTVRPKPSSMYPSPDPKTRGQNKNFVNQVLGSVKNLFKQM
jgi:hypothetical protein